MHSSKLGRRYIVLSSIGPQQRCDDCPEDKRVDYRICLVLYCVPSYKQSTQVRAAFKGVLWPADLGLDV